MLKENLRENLQKIAPKQIAEAARDFAYSLIPPFLLEEAHLQSARSINRRHVYIR